MEKSKRDKILKEHPYDIWIASDGRVKTYVLDESKPNGRRLVAKSSREKLEKYIVSEYVKNNPERKIDKSVEHIFNEWIKFSLQEKDIEKNTSDRYQNDYDKFISGSEFSKMDIEEINATDVTKFLKKVVNENEITRKMFTSISILLNNCNNRLVKLINICIWLIFLVTLCLKRIWNVFLCPIP